MLTCEATICALVVALEEAGATAGLKRGDSAKFALHTVVGSAAMLAAYPDKSPEQLRAQVTSPSGTTEAGIGELTRNGALEKILTESLAAALAN